MGKSIWSLGEISRSHLSRICVQHVQKRYFDIHSQVGPTKEQMDAVRQDLYQNLCRENIRLLQKYPIPEINNPIVQAKRSAMFSKERERQMNSVGRIEKITVDYQSTRFPESATLIMNKKISTPFHCVQHLGGPLLESTVAAEVNGQLWDLHRPIEDNCSLRLLSMKSRDDDPYQVNRIFWRSCSFMLGAVCESAFRDHIYVELHSFPSPNVRSGSFLYDVDLKLRDWIPNSDETRVLSAEMIKLSRKKLPFERLEVDKDLALEMFQDNKYKSQQIPEIAQTSADGKTICLYRVGNFIDISKGPLMAHTGLLGKCTITAVLPLPQSKTISETLYRVQGVALPAGFLLNHFAYGIIEQRGRKFNQARVPGAETDTNDMELLTSAQQAQHTSTTSSSPPNSPEVKQQQTIDNAEVKQMTKAVAMG